MDLTPGQQRLVFVVVVLALAGLGIYLVSGRSSGSAPAAAPSAPASAPSSASGAASGVPPSVVPTTTSPLPTSGPGQIYQWLPFSAADLSAAAQATQGFAKAYATWSYTETKADYAAKLSGLVTAQESAILQDDYMTPGVAQPRTADKQVSTGAGTIDQISSFGTPPAVPQTSIVFLVTINQKVTSTQPTQTQNSQYAITVARSGGGTWQVSDIQLHQLGNQGIQ